MDHVVFARRYKSSVDDQTDNCQGQQGPKDNKWNIGIHGFLLVVSVANLMKMGRSPNGAPDFSNAGINALMLLGPLPRWFEILQSHSN
jgi:hypothetical protein